MYFSVLNTFFQKFVSPKVKMIVLLFTFILTMQGHLTPEGAVYATGLATGLALGAVVVGVLVAAAWYVTRRRS